MEKLVLDPRTKIFLVLCMSVSITVVVPMYVEILNMLLFAFLFFFNNQKKGAIKLILFFSLLISVSYTQNINPFFA